MRGGGGGGGVSVRGVCGAWCGVCAVCVWCSFELPSACAYVRMRVHVQVRACMHVRTHSSLLPVPPAGPCPLHSGARPVILVRIVLLIPFLTPMLLLHLLILIHLPPSYPRPAPPSSLTIQQTYTSTTNTARLCAYTYFVFRCFFYSGRLVFGVRGPGL
jgi:hypothetical protein